MALLQECARYDISTASGDYYRLGGFGCAQIKFSAKSLPKLQTQGFVDNPQGYWKTTEAGLAVLAAHLRRAQAKAPPRPQVDDKP